MRPDRIEHFRSLLTQRHDALRDTMARRTGGAPGALSVAPNDGSPDDASTVDQLNDDAFAQIQVADGEMSQVQQALDRLDDGSYGECIDCDEPIPEARLEVEPWAARCVGCQEAWERGHPVGAGQGSRSM